MDNLHYRLIFYLDKSRRKKRNSRKEPFKSSNIPKFRREILQNMENIALRSSQIFYIFVLRVESVTYFELKVRLKLCKTIFSTHY